MRSKLNILSAFFFFFLISSVSARAAAGDTCVSCHSKQTPNIVADWKQSHHSEAGVSCDTCHGNAHTNAADADKAKIPTPETCAQCHAEQVAQFKKGKHSMAWAAMEAMPTIHYQPMAQTEGMKGCGSCHKLGLKSPSRFPSLRSRASVLEWRRATRATRGIRFQRTKRVSLRRARPATWASITRSGKCIRRRSTVFGIP
jgi:hypothetical protein